MKYYKIDAREYNWHHTPWRPYTFGIRMDSSTGYATDNLVIDLHNTRRLNAVRIDGKTPDILSRDMRFKYYSDRVQEHGVEMVMELPDHFPWQKKHDSIKRIEEALDWIKQNVKCKWSLRVGRLLKKKKLFVKFSFEDISTAVMFRLTF